MNAKEISVAVSLTLVVAVSGLPMGCRALRTGVRTVSEEPKEGIVLSQEASRLRGVAVDDVCVFLSDAEPAAGFPLQSDTIRKLVDKVKPAVLNIYVKTANPVGVYLLGVPVPGTRVDIPGESLGSGFICSPDGYVLTNAHVVTRAEKLAAKTYDGREHRLEIVAVDERNDIALLRMTDGDAFPYLPMISSKNLSVGDWVIAIGNPLGFNHLVSHGIFSHRYMPDEEDTSLPEFIFSDTPINPGNSGGPLIELGGRAVGINTAILRETQGMSLAIPAERVKRFISEAIREANGR